MAATITIATQTMFAELLQRCLDAEFDELYDERGTFHRIRSKGRLYWQHQRKVKGKLVKLYVGPVTDKSISDRVSRFAGIKSDYKQRRELVRAVIAAGLQQPVPPTGEVVEAMWKAGFFRLRGVLIGTMAYGCYGGLLGVRLTADTVHTDDADFAQFWGISNNIGDSMPPILDVLRRVDATFAPIPTINDPAASRFRNKAGYKVEFLTPNRGSEEHQRHPASMPALGGASAQPLRHLDYLIHQPERSVLLYAGGIPVTVPRAERYAVHKLIVGGERTDNPIKARKDFLQAGALIDALAAARPLELGEVWLEAMNRGPRWKAKLEAGVERISEAQRDSLAKAAERARQSTKRRRG